MEFAALFFLSAGCTAVLSSRYQQKVYPHTTQIKTITERALRTDVEVSDKTKFEAITSIGEVAKSTRYRDVKNLAVIQIGQIVKTVDDDKIVPHSTAVINSIIKSNRLNSGLAATVIGVNKWFMPLLRRIR